MLQVQSQPHTSQIPKEKALSKKSVLDLYGKVLVAGQLQM